jgi:hypothetical protein
MKLGARLDPVNGFKHFVRGARGQHIAPGLRHVAEDRGHLRGGLALGKDYLRHAGAQRAMMVELGEAHVFKGHDLQPLKSIIHPDPALADFVEQSLDQSAIHQRFSFAAA